MPSTYRDKICALNRYEPESGAYRLKFYMRGTSTKRHRYSREGGNEVKRAAIFLTLISLMVVVFAGVALAAVIKGNDRANYLVGTSTDDAIYGYGGADRIHARGGPDALHLGWGTDRGHAKRGDDYISAVDRSKDFISCGPGADRARANPGDNVAEGCEKVIREGIRVD